MDNWLLPEYIEDILPVEARRIEAMRRRVLDLMRGHGYELVVPPMIEYLESLLSGTGRDLDLRMFKLVDQLSGRLMGLRADITPQAARIDAHLLNRRGVTRLCYCGSVVHTLPSGLSGTREPLQVGAEIYGHAGIESDVEIQRLMLEALAAAGITRVQLDLGHVGVLRGLARMAALAPQAESELYRALQAKDVPALRDLTAPLGRELREALLALPGFYGRAAVLGEARRLLPAAPEIGRALDDLAVLAERLKSSVAELAFDLSEARGYHYHSGVVFAAYAPGSPNALALGGRYDEVGKAFGRARPATGFSADLRALAAAAPAGEAPGAIRAPHRDDPALRERIAALRAAGEVVIVELPGHENTRDELGCDRELRFVGGEWRVETI
ncbi:MAG TPA: ATP phosphoribosyltransferase regulatory subunit [Burkholderiales bacterium]|nr:ATP phosphoribosyltransferase regulatory subunit [Burkholderiales bacterium]